MKKDVKHLSHIETETLRNPNYGASDAAERICPLSNSRRLIFSSFVSTQWLHCSHKVFHATPEILCRAFLRFKALNRYANNIIVVHMS